MKTINYIKIYRTLYFSDWKYVILGIGALPILTLVLVEGLICDILNIKL